MYEQEIRQLATEIRHAVVEYKGTHPNATPRLVRVRRPDFTLKYREDAGFANFPPERIEEDIWDSRDQERFQEPVVKALGEYKSVESVLRAQSGSIERLARDVSCPRLPGPDDTSI